MNVLKDSDLSYLHICPDMDYMLGVIVVLGIVLRCMVSLHPYSGQQVLRVCLKYSTGYLQYWQAMYAADGRKPSFLFAIFC